MRRLLGAAVAAALSMPAGAGGGPGRTVYVNCDGGPGDGSWSAPHDSITASLPSAEALSADYHVTLDVRGVCDAETFPIRFGFPVHLRGQRWGRWDGQGWPLPDAWRDTVIVRPASAPAPASMIRITADGVRVSKISLDGGLALPGDDGVTPPPNAPAGILVQGADGFSIDGVRIANATLGVRADGSRGTIAGNYIGPVNAAVAVFGATPPEEATVLVWNNRILYRTNGLATAGGVSANATTGTPAGTHVSAHFWRNDIGTTWTETGPTNPAAIRIAAVVDQATEGHTETTVLYNRITGPTKYAIMTFAGPSLAVGRGPYTGTIDAVFHGTTFDAAAESSAISIVSFTNTRATIWPDPRYAPAPLMRGATFSLRHGGDLDDVLIDHRQQPDDVPPNALFIDGEPIDYQTFVALPP